MQAMRCCPGLTEDNKSSLRPSHHHPRPPRQRPSFWRPQLFSSQSRLGKRPSLQGTSHSCLLFSLHRRHRPFWLPPPPLSSSPRQPSWLAHRPSSLPLQPPRPSERLPQPPSPCERLPL